MKIYLFTTEVDRFRSPAVLDRVRQRLRDGGTVAMATRDHPETVPDGVVHAGDDWAAVVAAGPALAVLDNLVFSDRRGRELRRWTGDEGRYRNTCAGVLGSVLNDLGKSGTNEVLLVSEEAEISDGWRDWMERHGVIVMVPDCDHEPVYCRGWFLATGKDHGGAYSYPEKRLVKRTDMACARFFASQVVDPRSAALLALAGEYSAVRFEYANPEDPRQLNAREDMFHRIVEDFAGSIDPREIISALEDMYDWVYEHVDFSRPGCDTGGKGG